ncbi:hypothetical protein D0Z07_8260 [Hyphodiscus hymeniophilus]|uniref:Uncharacterized protein n=1 Tax=Hyphodiscus hymeniophilus TaxID=353542 RepID=A0A9P6VDM6_9HELO|nr:hypothetical protein D0Z07_8260 [Hyphodiscus hymeniophilus]
MSKSSENLMDIEAGGEQTQYEGSSTFVKPHAKESGQFNDSTTAESTEAWQSEAREKKERGEKTAENVRYGEAISEHGFGGETVGNSGSANQGSGYGGTEKDGEGDGNGQTRREQGYGGGSGVGA